MYYSVLIKHEHYGNGGGEQMCRYHNEDITMHQQAVQGSLQPRIVHSHLGLVAAIISLQGWTKTESPELGCAVKAKA